MAMEAPARLGGIIFRNCLILACCYDVLAMSLLPSALAPKTADDDPLTWSAGWFQVAERVQQALTAFVRVDMGTVMAAHSLCGLSDKITAA